jgi:hypothetical protein
MLDGAGMVGSYLVAIPAGDLGGRHRADAELRDDARRLLAMAVDTVIATPEVIERATTWAIRIRPSTTITATSPAIKTRAESRRPWVSVSPIPYLQITMSCAGLCRLFLV